MKRKYLVFSVVLIMIVFIVNLKIFSLHSLKITSAVNETEIHHASQVLFYKDNCPECKELLKESYFKLKREGTVFVNMNNKSNKKYREEYAIVFVPTLYVKDKEFIGKKDIQKQLQKEEKK